MSSFARPIIWCTVDPEQQIALITGRFHWIAVEEVVGPDYLSRYSNAHGYVLDMQEVAELATVAVFQYAIWHEREQKLPKMHRKGRGIKLPVRT